VNRTAQTIGAVATGIGALGNLFGARRAKDGGPITDDGKRNIKNPMHGLGWLKGK
jgi:hypothetical protein